MNNLDKSFAVLIDAENVSPKYIGLIIDEANKYGKLNYRRVYGDWTKPDLSKWKDACLSHALTSIQQFSSASGKNSSDFSLVIDAMDILNSKKVEGFFIVSSDGDFTKLITRLKEDNMDVFGMGEEKTPIALVNAFEGFTYLDKLLKSEEEDNPKPVKKTTTKPKTNGTTKKKVVKGTSITSEKQIIGHMKMLIHQDSDDIGWADYSRVVALLKKKYPGFHPRNYGKNMKDLTFFKAKKDFSIKTENTALYIKNK